VGLLRGFLIVQTFAAHLRATKGAQMILHGPDEGIHAAIGALGLASASVSVIVQYCPDEIVLTFLRWRGHWHWLRLAR
jgi:hypothetical protein